MKQEEEEFLVLLNKREARELKVNTDPQHKRSAGVGIAGTYIADIVLACKHRSVLRPKNS